MKKEYFRCLFNLYHKKVFLFVRSYMVSSNDAADVVQEIFIHIWRYIDRIQESPNPDAIIFKTSKQEIANFYRRQKMQFSELDENCYLVQNEESVDEHDHQLKVDKLNLLLQALPERRKVMVLHSVVDELSYAEIATRFNISKTAVAKQISKALNYLRSNF